MIEVVNCVERIDREKWGCLIEKSSTATWFQTYEAYDFFAGLPELFIPFVYGVMDNGELNGICVGYITKEKKRVKQLLTRRAIITGGPMLAEDISEEDLEALLNAVRDGLRTKAIYIETRNLNDYSRWKEVFEKCGFEYVPHLNFHVHTNQPWDDIKASIGKHRQKYIRLSFRDGVEVADDPTIGQLMDYYELLNELYKTKVHMPCFPYQFFEQLYKVSNSKFLFVIYNGKIVGGSVCVTLPGIGVYEWFACGKDVVYKNIHPSSVTKYAGMKFAADNGYKVFDMMGAGKPNEKYGVRDFKAEFGGELVEHGRFLHVCNKPLYSLGKLGVKILKRCR